MGRQVIEVFLALSSIFSLTRAVCTSLPQNLTLQANTRLANPFAFYDGRNVTNRAEWECRRTEISELFQRLELGIVPAAPDFVAGQLSSNHDSITIAVGDLNKTISFSVSIRYPNSSSSSPWPAIIALGGTNIPIPNDFALITYMPTEIAALGQRGRGKFYDLYGPTYPAGWLAAVSWGAIRLIDALETLGTESRINLARLGVTGCSENGKGAFLVGALDTRVALTIPQETGGGGTPCWRLSNALYDSGGATEPGAEATAPNVSRNASWFSPTFDQYTNRVDDLPFDHHFLPALVAPRGLLVLDNSGVERLGPESAYGCVVAGRKVYDALAALSRIGFIQVGGHSHCAFPPSVKADLDVFIDFFLRGGLNSPIQVFRTDGRTDRFIESQWVDWQSPGILR
ncbi:hypothetical protein FA15DRAFT_669432, partial [Coprinopsis marcescibilis]